MCVIRGDKSKRQSAVQRSLTRLLTHSERESKRQPGAKRPQRWSIPTVDANTD